jgi:hypothetical protein
MHPAEADSDGVARWRSAAGVLVAGLLLAGCIAVPSATAPEGPVGGQAVQRDALDATLREAPGREVLYARWGPPTFAWSDIDVAAYAWSERQRDWTVYGLGGTWVPDVWKFEIENRERPVVFVQFDAAQRAVAVALESQSLDTSLRAQALRWLQRRRVAVSSDAARPVGGAGDRVVYVFAAPALRALPLLGSAQYRCALLTVEVDGQAVGELEAGAVLGVAVAPGAHEIGVEPWPAYRYTPAERSNGSINHASSVTLTEGELAAGEARYFEVSCAMPTSWRPRPRRVTLTLARLEADVGAARLAAAGRFP